MKSVLLSVIVILLISCTPKNQTRVGELELQTFSPIPVDMEKITAEDYSECIAVVNSTYAPETQEYTEARLNKEEGMFLYIQVFSGASSACYRVTVDKNRKRIINMKPDCVIEE